MKSFKNSQKNTRMSKSNPKRLRKYIRHKKNPGKHDSPTLSSSKLTPETNSSSVSFRKEDEEDDMINLVPSSFILFDDDNNSIINLYDIPEELESTKGETENNFGGE